MRLFTIAVAVSCLLPAITASTAHAVGVRTVRACEIDNPPANCNSGNMYAIEVTEDVPNGAYVHVPDPGCMNDATGDIQRMLKAAVAVSQPNLALFSGPISKVVAGPVGNYLRNQGGEIGKYFSPYPKNGAMCAPIVATVPVAADVVGYRLLAANGGGDYTVCNAGAECSIGWSKFQSEPAVQGNSAMRAVTTIL